MKKLGFLANLRKKSIIALVEPSEEVKQSYIEKSSSNIESAKILLKNNKFEESVALSYYSMYHFVTALLFKAGIKSENHNATIQMLFDIFGVDNKELSSAKKDRLDKQYYVNFKINREEAQDTIIRAEKFNNLINDFISKINNNQIKEARGRFEVLTKK